MKKISVRGAAGSGKSTLACAVADKIGVKFIDLDDLFWLPGWVGRSDEEFLAEVRKATEGTAWVLAGNYTRIQDSLKDQIDTVIWLDYPKPLVMKRVIVRTLRRSIRREACCNGNYERPFRAFYHPDSIIWWAFTTHAKVHRRCDEFFADQQNAGKQLIKFRTPREAEAWLRQLGLSHLGVR